MILEIGRGQGQCSVYAIFCARVQGTTSGISFVVSGLRVKGLRESMQHPQDSGCVPSSLQARPDTLCQLWFLMDCGELVKNLAFVMWGV